MAIGQIPVTKQASVSGASGPSQESKPAPSVNYSPNKLGEGTIKTVIDGKTKVTSSVSKENPADDISRGARQSYFQEHGTWPPCINVDCRSYGRPHPNCNCYGPLSQAGTFYAHGGYVCSGPHHEKCEHYADGGTVADNTHIHNNPQYALDHIVAEKGLLHLLTKTGHSKSGKHMEDYVDHAKKGQKKLHNHTKNVIGHEKYDNPEHGPEAREALKNHLTDLSVNPQKLLDVGGSLGESLPGHAAQLGAMAGNAVQYLNGIKPMRSKNRPLDNLSPVDKMDEEKYNKHLDIAQNPMLVLHKAKEGTLSPQELMTLKVLYPQLHKNMLEKVNESLVDAKSKGKDIPYKQRQSLSTLLEEPLDSTMTVPYMQAIIKSSMPSEPSQNPQQGKSKPKRASGVELNQINKVNELNATDIQDRAMDRLKKD